MRQFIVKLGHVQSVIVITVFSCLASISISRLISFCYFLFGIKIVPNVTIATLVPLILAPPLSWYIIGLLLKIDQLEVEMRNAATFDPLTGLFSRRAFLERAGYALDIAAREGFKVSVLLVDLDHFKTINDRFGHTIGDKVLATFGKAVTQIIRKSDVVGRLGGEEFAFLLPNTSQYQAWEFSERLHEEINNTLFDPGECAIQVTMSIGIVTLPTGAGVNDIEKLLSMADKAMYHAKKNGRDQSAIYHESYARLDAG
jgi:diguanylate cyclase (GGDEF)-like protein